MITGQNKDLKPHLNFEMAFWNHDLLWVAGIDEAGRGALAGPVSAGAVVLPATPDIVYELDGVRDSKQMSPVKREYWAGIIRDVAITCGVGFASAAEVDKMRIVPATRLAARRALAQLAVVPQHVILDYLFLPELDLPQTSLIKGDARSLSVACASVLAKTARDALMVEAADQYPEYGFARHKGYGTLAHRKAMRRVGPCEIHRRSFTLKEEKTH